MTQPGKCVEKTLSRNDTGETGSHQAGLLVPKAIASSGFFPGLDPTAENPRASVPCVDENCNRWVFEFIYYNNIFRGGTRDEYRLTCMTPFLRAAGVKAGDVLVFASHHDGGYQVSTRKSRMVVREPAESPGILTLRGGWKVIRMRGV